MRMKLLPLLSVLALAACGTDSPNDPTSGPSPAAVPTPQLSLPNIAGTYSATNMWLVQFQRLNDGWRSSYNCTGTLTLSQGTAVGGVAPVSGFGVVGSPCAAISFQLSGSVEANGTLTLRGDGPRPPECEAPRTTTYQGVVSGRTLSARSTDTLTVSCVGSVEGTHRLDYIITGLKTS